jgi:type II secretion system protein I
MRRARQGFTLLEVVVALAILGSAMVVLLQTHWNALDAHDRQKSKVLMNGFVTEALNRAKLEIAAGNLTGGEEFGERWEGYSYQYEAQLVGEQWPNLYEVLVTIETPDNAAEASETSAMIYIGQVL